MTKTTAGATNPERQAYDHELKMVLESAIDALPEVYRSVFVLRAVEGLSVAETAACLDVGAETVKTRLHRARALLRKEIDRRAGIVAADIFPFHLSRCDRVVEACSGESARGLTGRQWRWNLKGQIASSSSSSICF